MLGTVFECESLNWIPTKSAQNAASFERAKVQFQFVLWDDTRWRASQGISNGAKWTALVTKIWEQEEIWYKRHCPVLTDLNETDMTVTCTSAFNMGIQGSKNLLLVKRGYVGPCIHLKFWLSCIQVKIKWGWLFHRERFDGIVFGPFYPHYSDSNTFTALEEAAIVGPHKKTNFTLVASLQLRYDVKKECEFNFHKWTEGKYRHSQQPTA